MRRFLALILLGACSAPASAESAKPDIALSRVDCGRSEQLGVEWYDDTVFDGSTRDAAHGCYIIRHGLDFMIWDLGMSVGLNVDGGSTKWKLLGPDRSVKDILAQHGITPTQVKFIGVSHIHFDHLAQSADFPHAKLFIGADDWMMMKDLPGSRSRYNHGLAPPNSVQPWLDNEENVEQVIGDRDIFGDGSVIMLNTPGHTPGHHSLLVRLESGAILLTGDLYESQQSFENDEVSKYDDNRADKLASHDRFKKIARNMNATVVIQHEPADVVKLPAFPNWAR